MRRCLLLGLSPLLMFILPAGLHAQIASVQRITYGYPLIDSLPRNQFPRGGTYTAVVQGAGLKNVTGFLTSNANVTGSVSSATDSAVTIQLSSTQVKDGDTANAPILSVSFTLLLPSGSFNSGAVTFDIVVGPPTQITSFRVSNAVEWIPAGVATTVTYSVTALWAGNQQFWYIGCGACVGSFGTFTGDQFSVSFSFTTVVTVTSNTDTQFSVIVGGVDGAGQGGTTGNAPLSPKTLTIPIVRTSSVSFQSMDDPLDSNPGTGGGLRIYPDASSPGDIAIHNRIKVAVSTSPPTPNVTIHFQAFDVDDPSSDDPAVDPNGPAGNDNRGNPGTNGGLNLTSVMTDSSGNASVVLSVTANPGDNFKVVATTSDTLLSGMTVQGLDVLNADGTVVPTSTANALATDMVTVWRHLHVEVDSMGPVSGNVVSARVLQVIPQGSFTKVFLDRVPDPENNRFESGLLTVPGVGAYKIVANANSVLTVSGTVPLAAAQKLSTLVDDDDFSDTGSLSGDEGKALHELPETFRYLESTFGAAYISPVLDGGGSLSNNEQNVPFVLNFQDLNVQAWQAALAHRNAVGSDTFWVAYIQLNYQPEALNDYDPPYIATATNPNPPQPILGITAPVLSSSLSDSISTSCGPAVPQGAPGSLVFLETGADYDRTVTNPLFKAAKAQTAPHEIGHQFGLLGDQSPACASSCSCGIMSYGACKLEFVPVHLNILRCRVKSPGR